MGLFDSVYFDCPSCGTHNGIEFQSKAGPDPYMHRFPPDAVPTGIAVDLAFDDDYSTTCDHCGVAYRVTCEVPRTVPLQLVAVPSVGAAGTGDTTP